jgi:hypothetical protein
VADIVAHQATFLGETVEALRRAGGSGLAEPAAPGLRVGPS